MNWNDEVRTVFRRLAALVGYDKTAEEIHVSRATLYRLVRGDTQTPTRAVRANIASFIAARKEPSR